MPTILLKVNFSSPVLLATRKVVPSRRVRLLLAPPLDDIIVFMRGLI